MLVPEKDITVSLSITDRPLDIARLYELAVHEACGAVSSFVGITRETFEGKTVLRLEYEAYVPMALSHMKRLAQVAAERFPGCRRFVIAHRTGLVPVTEASVVIHVGSAHRRDGLLAVAYVIDELKATVPIWKKEIYSPSSSPSGNPDDAAAWKANREFTSRHITAPSS